VLLEVFGKRILNIFLFFFVQLLLFLLLLLLLEAVDLFAGAWFSVEVCHFLKFFRENQPYTYTPQVVWHSKHLHHISYHYLSSLQPIKERTGPSSRQISQNLLLLPQYDQLIMRIPVIVWNYRRISNASNLEQSLEACPDLQLPPSIGPYGSSYFRKTFQTPKPFQESSIPKFLIHTMLRNRVLFSLNCYP